MAQRIHIRAALRSAPRAAEVARALTRFGFGSVLREVGLDKYVTKSAEEVKAVNDSPTAVRVRLLLEDLGSTFIKLGQIASTRADLLPPDWIEELSKLRGTVPPEPWEGPNGIEQYLRAELGDRIERDFESIEHNALAGASIGQVHRAKLKGGQPVILKVLRPGIRDRLASDVELMRLLTGLVRAHVESLGFDPGAVVEEFSRQLQRETDLLIEAQSMARMREDFTTVENVTFPKVYREQSTSSVLVMEEIHGTVLSDLDLSTLDDSARRAIVQNAAEAVFKQCLEIGFFHADPHPGNIFVVEDCRLCFVDCGMTGLIEPQTLDQLAGITHGAIEKDLDRVVRLAIELSDGNRAMLDNRAFRAATWQFIDQFGGGSLESIRMGQLLEEFFSVLRRFQLQCPAEVVYLIKALTTIEGVATSMAPEFDIVAHVRPYVENLVRARYGAHAIRERTQKAAVRYIDLLESLPSEISSLLRSVRRNTLSLQLEHRGVDRLTEEIERASMHISWSLGISAAIVGSSVLILADSIDRDNSLLTIIASIVFLLAIGIASVRLIGAWLRRKL